VNVELVLDARAIIGESPLWVPPEAALYWADIKAPALHRFDPESGDCKSWTLAEDIGAFALDGDGRALVALRSGLYWLDLATGETALAAQAPFDPALIRFNEGACDSAGRFWVGTMTDPVADQESERKGLLHSFTAGEGLVPVADVAFITNGMAWDADEKSFYLSHSLERRIYKFAYDAAAGRLGARQAFAELDQATPGIPDGAAVDASGHYWCAIHGGGRLHRYAPDGSLAEVVEMPVSQPTMCCFAGPQLADLYVTSAREKLDAAALKREPRAGGLFRLRPPVPGHPRHWRVEVAEAK
jgi:sugar lactone lactonase YvrE